MIYVAAMGEWFTGANGKKYFRSNVQPRNTIVGYKSKSRHLILNIFKVSEDFP